METCAHEFYKEQNNTLVLKIKAVPNSSKNEICGLFDDALKVKIKAPAVENKANEELVCKTFKSAQKQCHFKIRWHFKTKNYLYRKLYY